ncbi:MAG TPA: glycosyltransferase [Thermoleophilaceae bacterium]|nr:glycosyltransferase [Thermoleophilaceae bacterium]
MKILVVSQMWPSEAEPDFGSFVAQVCRALEQQGHELEVVAIDKRGQRRAKYLRLARDAKRAARRFEPDVVYGHFLTFAGPAAVRAGRAAGAPVVLTAHGTDVGNVERSAFAKRLTRWATRRASRVIAVSDWLRMRLVAELPELADKIDVVDCGVDMELFRARDGRECRVRVGWEGEGPYYLFVGTLDERKNVLPLVQAFTRLDEGSLAIVGAGPLRDELRDRPRVKLWPPVSHAQIAEWMAAADYVCQPTDGEAFGQAILEAMACERSVLATTRGGPPEFVPPEAGVLVDPTADGAIERGLRELARLPSPNPAARAAAAKHDVRVQASRIAEILQSA